MNIDKNSEQSSQGQAETEDKMPDTNQWGNMNPIIEVKHTNGHVHLIVPCIQVAQMIIVKFGNVRQVILGTP